MSTVSKEEVTKYYIQCELDNIIDSDHIKLKEGLYNANIPRLLEALSFTFRANSVFDYIESNQYKWEKREIPVDDILLTGMGGTLDKLVYSDRIQQNPHKFVEYIQSHPDDELLTQFTPKHVPTDRKLVLLREHGEKLVILDGSHRFLTMMMNGQKSVTCYVALFADENAKPTVGDAVFIRLRKFWEQTDDPAFKKSLEQTVLGMMKSSVNGSASVQAYWIDMAPSEAVKMVGQRLINESRLIF